MLLFTTALIMRFPEFQENPLAKIKRVDCALLPPCRRTLEIKVRRTQYVTSLWLHAGMASPGNSLSPTDFGWTVENNLMTPIWFDGPVIPDRLFTNVSNNTEDIVLESESSEIEIETTDGLVNDSDGEVWSEESDSEEDDLI